MTLLCSIQSLLCSFGSFFCSLHGPLELNLEPTRTDQGPQLTHYIRQLIASWSNFSPYALCFHMPLKKCFLPSVGTTFLQVHPQHFTSKMPLLDPQPDRKRAIDPLLFPPIAHLSVRFGSLPLHMPMKSLTLARAWCFSSLQEPNWIHNLMHRSLQLVHCSCHLLFFICPDCSQHMPCAIFAQFLRHHRPIAPSHARTIALKSPARRNAWSD